MGDGVLAPAVVAVVGGEQRRVDRPGDLDERRVGPALVGDPVVLELDEEVVCDPKISCSRPGELAGLGGVAGEQRLGDDAAEAAGRRDQALVVAFEQLPVDPRLVVVALEVGVGGELHQVAVAGARLGEDGQVVVELLAAFGVAAGVVDPAPAHRALVARVARHVGLECR